MNTTTRWKRVSRRRPCPICGRPDWCLYCGPDDSPDACICARTESDRRAGEGGWLHRLRAGDYAPAPRRAVIQPAADGKNLGAMAEACRRALTAERLRWLADSLGLPTETLTRLHVGWSSRHGAYTWPQRSADGRVIGIRLRFPDGHKLSVRGGHEGLFLPSGLPRHDRLVICEGPTDTAASLTWGFPAVGRPSCSGGVAHLHRLVCRLMPDDVTILADGDDPGIRGAHRLAARLLLVCHGVRVITPPAGLKDARAWYGAGGTAEDVEAVIGAAPVWRLTFSSERKG